jgi:hypothetical protein
VARVINDDSMYVGCRILSARTVCKGIPRRRPGSRRNVTRRLTAKAVCAYRSEPDGRSRHLFGIGNTSK